MNISMKLVGDLKIRSRRANEILGICPLCNCRDANFNISKCAWRCWHCNASGRILTDEGYVFKEEEEPLLDIPEVRKLYTSLASKYHEGIIQPVTDYLISRGLTQQTIDGFLLGFCSTEYLDDYANKLAEESGVLCKNYPVLTNRITIPYLVAGEVTDLRGRIVNTFTYKENTPTYSSLARNHKTRGAIFLFNYDIIAKNNRIILTEGEFKAIVGFQYGFPIVAMPGIYGWQREWATLFKDKELILAPDNDGFGGIHSPAYLMARMIQPDVPNAKVAYLRLLKDRDNKADIDSLIVGGNIKTFERAIEGAIPIDRWLEKEGRKGNGRRRT